MEVNYRASTESKNPGGDCWQVQIEPRNVARKSFRDSRKNKRKNKSQFISANKDVAFGFWKK